jgi:hypothetical protein
MTTPADLRAERIKAHGKMRDEVRNAVKETMLKEGFGRDEIRQAIRDVLMDEVRKKIEGKDISDLVRAAVAAELTKMCGGNYVANTVKEMVKYEAQRIASEFVEKSVLVKAINTEDTW